MLGNRLMDVMMKIILPACFIALKLTGSFIDFMLGLANANVQEDTDVITSQVRDSRTANRIELISSSVDYRYLESYETVIEDSLALNGTSSVVNLLVSKGIYTLKNLLGKNTVESFKFRTCVRPKLSENAFGETEIVYESLTAQDLPRKRTLIDFNNFYRYKHFSKLQKFVISDEGLPCVNTIETVYLGLLVTVFAFGIVSLFRLTYFKAELRKLFDPREGCTLNNS